MLQAYLPPSVAAKESYSEV